YIQSLLPLFERTPRALAQYLAVDLCIGFHQLLDKGSPLTINVVTNLITGDVDQLFLEQQE
ncbi:hypothetical protein ACQP3D_31105, partial [Escherichia coli]